MVTRVNKLSLWFFEGVVVLLLSLGIALLSQRVTYCLSPSGVETLKYCLDQAWKYEPALKLLARTTQNKDLQTSTRLLNEFRPFASYEDYFLGLNSPKPTTILVLLQNDTELRANGGFFGSYLVLSLKDAITEVRFQDIYVPDGQLVGHVDPPSPIQQAFGQGWFKLRDSDWYPDFPTSAESIRWFFVEGKEIDPDLLVTVNQTTIKKALEIVGPVQVPDYNLIVTPANLYSILQTEAEVGFFPGSTQKKDALTAVGKAVLSAFERIPFSKKLAIVDLLIDDLDNQNILINSRDSNLQELILAKNWGGELKPLGCDKKDRCLDDTLAIIETNLGANKANCCTTRLTTHSITRQNNYVKHDIKIEYHNQSYEENPSPPDFYGGNYVQYFRAYLPTQAVFVEISATPSLPTSGVHPEIFQTGLSYLLTQGENFGFKEYGFFHSTRAKDQSQINISYLLPISENDIYQLNILKQNGLTKSPQIIYLQSKQEQTDLTNDYAKKTLLD